jgi:hypothetical protein
MASPAADRCEPTPGANRHHCSMKQFGSYTFDKPNSRPGSVLSNSLPDRWQTSMKSALPLPQMRKSDPSPRFSLHRSLCCSSKFSVFAQFS